MSILAYWLKCVVIQQFFTLVDLNIAALNLCQMQMATFSFLTSNRFCYFNNVSFGNTDMHRCTTSRKKKQTVLPTDPLKCC